MSKIIFENYLKIGLIQTIVDDNAWIPPNLNMRQEWEDSVWHEIKKGFRSLKNGVDQPNIVVLPEVTVPHGYVNDLKGLGRSLGAVVIAGLDFEAYDIDKVRNKAIITVPQGWPNVKPGTRQSSVHYFGKMHFSKSEKVFFPQVGRAPFPDPVTYVINAGCFGNIGVAICSDFFDIERFIIYKGRIHHMLVIAHNPDTTSYYFLAEAISRLVYCNVIICNTGHFGDTLVFSPFKEHFRRTIYRHTGANLFSSQVVSLPVLELENAQNEIDHRKLFKSIPPGYVKKTGV